MKVLLSPAKSIDIDQRKNTAITTTSPFLEETDYLVNKLKKYSAGQLKKMMHISTDLAEMNHHRYQNWETPIESNTNNCPAIYAFTGEVYRGLDAQSLNDQAIDFAQNSLVILSGLYGVLRPLDLIYPYRLEMGTSIKVTPKKTNLYQFWGDKIAQFLNQEMNNEEVVINLASNEYFKAVDQKKLKHKIITPVFKELKNGEYKIVMTYAKNARGLMARYIIDQRITDPEQIKDFDRSNYRYDANLSTESEWVFTR